MLYSAIHDQVTLGMNLRREWIKMARMDQADQIAFHAKVLDEYSDALKPGEILEAVGRLRAAARTLLVRIMNVDERPAE
jgi:hypothetical protein